MTTELIHVSQFTHNPWQTRAIDKAHAQALADDIKANGLLQPPVARGPNESGYQLALGHHRLAAFKILAAADKAYSVMPVEIRELTDIEMADIAIAENEKRKPLSPIEKAQALRRLVDEFKLSQEDAGKRFGITQAAVSHLLRLLKLPASIQTLTDGARLPERHARQLVTLSKSLPAQAEAVAKKVAEAAPEEKDYTFDSAVRNVLTTRGRQMWSPPFKTNEQLPIEHVAKAAAKMGLDKLPLCKGCEFFLERDRMNYCARPGCFDAKKEAARWKAAAAAAKTLGIAVAKPGEKVEIVFDGDDNKLALARAALKAKHESLRVVVSPHADNDTWRPEARERKELLGSHWLALASTDQVALKKSLPAEAVKPKVVTKGQSPAAREKERQRKFQEERAANEAKRKVNQRLIDRAALACMGVLPTNEAILDLISTGLGWQVENQVTKSKDASAKQKIVMAELCEDYLGRAPRLGLYSNPEPAQVAEALTALATKLKIKLPADFAPNTNGHAAPNGKAPKAVKESGVSTGKLSKRAKAKAAKPVGRPAKKGKRK